MNAQVERRFDRLVPVLVTALVMLVAMLTITTWPVGVMEDDGIYTVLARSLATGEGFRLTNLPGSPNATHYPPGYPFVLSLLWRVGPAFPGNIVVFKFANAVFLGLAALGTWYFAHARLGMPRLSAGLVAIFSTISVVVLLVTGLVLSEPLFLALLMASLIVAERTVDTGDWRLAVLAGALLGALALVRTLGALAIPAAVLVLLLRRHVRAAIVLGAVAALFVVPWQLWVGAHQHEVAPILMGKFGAYGPWMREGYETGGWDFARNVIGRNLKGLYGMLSYMLAPVPSQGLRVLALAVVLTLGLAGVWSLVRRMPVSVIFLALYIGTVLLWPFDANRFLWAIWPLLVIAVWQGARFAWQWKPSGNTRWLRMATLALVLVPLTGFLAYNARGYRQQWWASIQSQAGGRARAVVEWVNRFTAPDDVIATENDLIVHLYTGRRATPVSSFLAAHRLRPLTDAEDLEALQRIITTYEPRYVIVMNQQSVKSAEVLADGIPATLRRVGKLPDAFIYERVSP